MTDPEFSRHTADLFAANYDPNREIRKFRTFIPEHVLKSFCGSGDPNMWVLYEENHMHVIGDSELLTLFLPESQDFAKQHWSNCFGNNDIYSSYFETLTRQTFQISGVSKFVSLQRVDREIYTQIADPIWHVHGNQSSGVIPFQRGDIYTFRKFLYLMTSLGSRERNMHLLAHNEFMENARIRRRKFIEKFGLDHVRDVWLRNSEQILDTPHHLISSTPEIFDLDQADYKANAMDRYMVFWEAGPGDEFVLTDASFGGFEGGQIGAKKNSQIDMTPLELEQHLYTKDFMWHQIYVLSPTLAVVLCHPSLMHPDLTKQQRKRWGLRRSLLETLPHDLPPRYYKDMKKSDLGFSKDGWQLPAEVERAFVPLNSRSYGRRDEDMLFPIHSLSPPQVALVNSVLLHNQELGPKIKSVCVRPPPSYHCFHQSLLRFQRDPWPKYSDEKQNDYGPLLQRLGDYLNTLPPTPPNLPSNYQYQPFHPQQLPAQQMFESGPAFVNAHYSPLSTGEDPRYEEPHFDGGCPLHLQAHSSTQSSLTSTFTPSSHSSYSLSSSSSQSSNSTKTTSLDTPRFEPSHIDQQQRNRSPTRREQSSQDHSLTSGSVHRSNTSGKSAKSKLTDKSSKSVNIVIEKTHQDNVGNSSHTNGYSTEHHNGHMHNDLHEYSYQGMPSHGRNPELPRSYPPSDHSSKKSSPNSPRAEPDLPKKRFTESTGKVQQIPASQVPKSSTLPEKNYVCENARQNPPVRSRTEPQTVPAAQHRPNGHYALDVQPLQRRARSPERHALENLPQPPRRVNCSLEKSPYGETSKPQPQQHHMRPPTKRSMTATEDRPSTRYEPSVQSTESTIRSPERNGTLLVDARGRRYEPVAESVVSMNLSTNTARNSQASQDRSAIEIVHDRLYQAINDEIQPQQQAQWGANTEQRNTNSNQQPQTANGHVYQMVSPSQNLPTTQAQRPSGGNGSQTQRYPQAQAQTQAKQPPFQPQPQSQLQAQSQPPQQPPQMFSSSRNTSNSTEHPMRPGVEIVRGRPQAPTVSDKLESKESQNALVPLSYQEYQDPPPQIPVIKQLRFETPTKSITHKCSDLSLAGSMLVNVGDTPTRTESEYDDRDDSYDYSSGSDGECWEDEGYADSEEAANKQQRVVRFADKPLPSPKPLAAAPRNAAPVFEKAALVRKGLETEKPNSRLGRRVDIPRPLSRNSQARLDNRKTARQQPPHNRRT